MCAAQTIGTDYAGSAAAARKGLTSFAVPASRTAHHATANNAASAEYCYSVFLRHLSRLEPFTNGRLPRVVAELEPGDPLGTVLAAVIAGADRCMSLDVQDHTDAGQNLRVFDELVTLFRSQAPIPRANVPIATQPHEWAFPSALAAGLEQALQTDRLPHGMQTGIMERNGFTILEDVTVERSDGLERGVLVPPYAAMIDKDARTYAAFVVARADAARAGLAKR